MHPGRCASCGPNARSPSRPRAKAGDDATGHDRTGENPIAVVEKRYGYQRQRDRHQRRNPRPLDHITPLTAQRSGRRPRIGASPAGKRVPRRPFARGRITGSSPPTGPRTAHSGTEDLPMAKILGTIATSHTPTIGFAYDNGKQNDADWAPIFAAYVPIQRWLAEKKPDAMIVIFNDHVTSFFLDHYSAFALGIGDSYAPADEGGGARALPPLPGHAKLATHIGTSLVADEFDMSFFQGKPLDHGLFSPMSLLCPHEPAWPIPVVPLQVGVLLFPIPSAKRCYKLGKRCGARSRASPKTSTSCSSRPADCRTRCTASEPGSTTRRGTNSSSRCMRTIPWRSRR